MFCEGMLLEFIHECILDVNVSLDEVDLLHDQLLQVQSGLELQEKQLLLFSQVYENETLRQKIKKS